MLNVDHLGRVFDFVAVPGCGLKCSISHVETLLDRSTSDVRINIEDSAVNISVSYHVQNEAFDTPAAIEGQFANIVLLT